MKSAVRSRFKPIEPAHTRPSVAKARPVDGGVGAEKGGRGQDVLLEGAVGHAAAIPVTAEVEAEDDEPLRAGFPAEDVVPGSAAAGAVADDEPRARERLQGYRGGTGWRPAPIQALVRGPSEGRRWSNAPREARSLGAQNKAG